MTKKTIKYLTLLLCMLNLSTHTLIGYIPTHLQTLQSNKKQLDHKNDKDITDTVLAILTQNIKKRALTHIKKILAPIFAANPNIDEYK